jgi:DNA-binding CsgD family transcriptional regulator
MTDVANSLEPDPFDEPESAVFGHIDDRFTVVEVTDHISAVIGWTAKEWTGTKLLDAVHPRDRTRLRRAGRGLDPVHIHVRLRARSNGWCAVRLVLFPSGNHRAGTTHGFVMVGMRSESSTTAQHRLEALEHHLWRIAQEIDLVGVQQSPALASSVPKAHLSHRQREIIRLLLRGQRVTTIADSMYLSQSTVRNHLSAAYRKLGVRSQEELLQHFLDDPERRR